jgi:formate hydrogenlyase subunit 6/NADH:ubiquinone oxidoreductase subunit I
MFKILQKTWQCGIVTVPYPDEPALISEHFRGRPEFDFERWRDARRGAQVCPTGAISVNDTGLSRQVTIDYGLCIYCGQCADASPEAVRVTRDFELATRDRASLISTAEYALTPEGTHQQLVALGPGPFGKCWAAPWQSGKWMRARAMAASWRLSH